MFLRLPAAWFMGLHVKRCDLVKCEVALPFRWRSQNPFKSTYFAAQCAAGEMSTGLLAMAHIEEAGKVSMLVPHIEAEFFKKANYVRQMREHRCNYKVHRLQKVVSWLLLFLSLHDLYRLERILMF